MFINRALQVKLVRPTKEIPQPQAHCARNEKGLVDVVSDVLPQVGRDLTKAVVIYVVADTFRKVAIELAKK